MNELYNDYSAHFSGVKAFSPSLQEGLFECVYPDICDKKSSVADLGCGKGEWIVWMRKKGFQDLHAFDMSKEELEYLKSSCSDVNVYNGNVIDLLEGMEEQFHVIHAKDLIEHLPKNDIPAFLKAVRLSLRKNGELWLLTFNAQSPFSNVTRYGDFTHENGFTPLSLLQVLHSAGFREIKIRGIHICPGGFKGKLRSVVGKIVYLMSRFLIIIRHGAGAKVEGVDLNSAEPDLWVVARK